MSIDARISGIQITHDKIVRLVLEDRDDKHSAGQQFLVIINPPANPQVLETLIGECIWGDSSTIMHKDNVFAKRLSYTRIKLVGLNR